MFGRKKKNDYEDKISESKFKLVYRSLQEIVKMSTPNEENDKVDNALLLRRIGDKAKTTLNFVDQISKDDDED